MLKYKSIFYLSKLLLFSVITLALACVTYDVFLPNLNVTLVNVGDGQIQIIIWFSGVFSISVSRRRGAVGVEGVGCGGGAGPFLKKVILSPK